DETYFHRIIPELLIQGGDRNTLNNNHEDDGYGKTPYFIEDEVNWDSINLPQERKTELENLGYQSNPLLKSHPLEAYTIAMANNGPNTNSSQFFILLPSVNDTQYKILQGRFTVIGKIIKGKDIIDQLNNIHTANGEDNPR